MNLLLKRICHVKQEVVDTGEVCSSEGKMPHVVDKRAANRSMCKMILNTNFVICRQSHDLIQVIKGNVF
jgi:hypothetical protein